MTRIRISAPSAATVVCVLLLAATSAVAADVVLQPGPTDGKDIWTTSVYSYAEGGGGPGGGLDDEWLQVGGWADEYHSLIEFDLSTMPEVADSATLQLFVGQAKGYGTTAMYLDRITEFWDWRIQGTGSDRERLWWADKPDATNVTDLPAPTVGQWYSIDITDLYNEWKSGTYPNYGIQLRPQNVFNTWNEFYSSDYVGTPALRPKLVVQTSSGTSVAAERAKSLLGTPYLWGGKGKICGTKQFVNEAQLSAGYSYWRQHEQCGFIDNDAQYCDWNAGVDCSGLVAWSYASFILAEKSANTQYNDCSEPIPTGEPLMPGDLVFEGEPGFKDHVAMYVGPMGDGFDVIESPSCERVVTKAQLSRFPYRRRLKEACSEDMLVIAHSPVTLTVTDPAGFSIDVDTFLLTEREALREVPGELYYVLRDVNDDGDEEDVVVVPRLKSGEYVVGVIPKPDAQPTDTYSLELRLADGTSVALAADTPVNEIPEEGYGVFSDGGEVLSFVPLKMDVKPKDRANAIRLSDIRLLPVAVLSTSSFDATTIDPRSVQFGPAGVGEYHNRTHEVDVDGDGRLDVVLHFAIRQAGLTTSDTECTLVATTLAGELVRGTDIVVLR